MYVMETSLNLSEFLNSTRYGCPLLPNLQVVLERIRQKKKVLVLIGLENPHKSLSYADDILYITSTPLNSILALLAKVNGEKMITLCTPVS